MGTEKPLSASAPPLAVRARGSDRLLSAGPSYTIGRDPSSDIVVPHIAVSRHHAVLKLDRGCWLLEDTGSTHGTYLGSQKVQKIILDGEIAVRLADPVHGPELTCSIGEPPRPRTVITARPATSRSATAS
jgi:pSer/pThr/pTyr-binding forkhead associated (FHA) protein